MSIMSGLRISALLAAWLLLFAGQALAASPLVEIKDLKQPVAAGSPTTYADLLKLIFPEPAAGQKETPQTPPVWQINDYYKKQPLTAKQRDGGVLALPIKAQGRPFLLLLVPATGEKAEEEGDAGEQEYYLLALFQTTPAPKLLDLVDIGQGTNLGMIEGFWCKNPDNPLFDLTPGTQACMIFQEHFNSGESFLGIHLLWVRNQRLERVLGVFTYGVKAQCRSFATRTVFRTEPDKGREFPKVVAELTLKMEPSPKDEDCDKQRTRGFTKSYRGVWRWNPAKQKYGRTGGNLDKLYKFYKGWAGWPSWP
ncbi:MAG: hypothetical protein ACYDIC_09050 [Desulfobaccales bacterium]